MKFKVQELDITNAELNITNAELEKIMHANEFLEVCVDKMLIRIYRNNTLKNEENSPLLINDFIIFEYSPQAMFEFARLYEYKTSGTIDSHQKKSTLKQWVEPVTNNMTVIAMVERVCENHRRGSYTIRTVDNNKLLLLYINNKDCVKLLTKKEIR